ncbi:unnamed protein product [Pleuronectes platessa]|uniref:Uncharacterized protein n=1 Tax=Pleuronectes platessa TaxID=8262 RepID=A0A9N7UCF1_PLEPL|nr:unnamed protein product [Pleuronectes platessa]
MSFGISEGGRLERGKGQGDGRTNGTYEHLTQPVETNEMALYSSAQIICISLSPVFPPPSLECQRQASRSQQTPLHADADAAKALACSPQMLAPMLSEPHISSLDEKMRDAGSVLE